MPSEDLSIGEVAARTGLAASALRFYEEQGLIGATRNPGNQRRYERSVLRRVSVIRAAQAVGLTLGEIREALDVLPTGRAPSAREWGRLSESWRARLDERIALMQRLRDTLGGCIGCGCLSLADCELVNWGDRVGRRGPGARFLLGDVPDGAPDASHGSGPA